MDLINECIDLLNRINDKYVEQVNSIAKDILKKHNHKVNDKALQTIFQRISDIKDLHPESVNEKTTFAVVTKACASTFDTLFGLAAAVSVAPTFMQKGFFGVNLGVTHVAKLFGKQFETGTYLCDNLERYQKGLLGALPALSSSGLYAISAMDLRPVLSSIVKDWWKNPRIIPAVGFTALGVAVGYSGAGMYNIASSIVSDPERICLFLGNLDPEYPASNAAFGAATNAKSDFAKVFATLETHDPKTHFIRYLKKKDIDDTLTNQARASLKSLSLFRKKSKGPQLTSADVPVHRSYSTPSMVQLVEI
jgi:hypothetical protein